jgi:TRAP-type transport system small permease protein
MKKAVERISRGLDLAAAGCFFSVMLLIIANILMRGIFKQPILGNYELVGYLTAMGVSFALAHCAQVDGHIAVGFVADRLPPRLQNAVALLVGTLSLGLWGVVIWSMSLYMQTIKASNLVSATAQIAVYPIIGLVTLGFAGFWFTLLVKMIQPLPERIGAVTLLPKEKAKISQLAEKAI